MKKVVASILCAVMIVTLLAVSPAPVAAASETSSFSATGASVNYIARAWYVSGTLYGTISASLHASWYACPNLVIGAGLEECGCSIPQWSNWLQMEAYGLAIPDVTGGVSFNQYTGGADDFAIRLRMVLQVPPNIRDWNGDADARCYTWEKDDPSLTPDTEAETICINYAQGWNLLYLLANFMGPY